MARTKQTPRNPNIDRPAVAIGSDIQSTERRPTLKPTLKKLCKKDPANWDKYINQVLASYRITPNLATAESPFFLVYGRDPNLPLHQLLEPMQCFLGDPDSGKLHLETHRLALAIVKKTLDENRFSTTQKTTSRTNPNFQIGDHVYFKNK